MASIGWMIVGMRVLRAEAQGAVAIVCFAAFLRVDADFFGGIWICDDEVSTGSDSDRVAPFPSIACPNPTRSLSLPVLTRIVSFAC